VGYWFVGTPFGAEWFAFPLTSRFAPIVSRDQTADASVIVVLTGGSTTYRAQREILELPSEPSVFRAMEAARVYRLMNGPVIITSGGIVDPSVQNRPEGEVMRDTLVRLGIPPDRILVEGAALNTVDHARRLKEMPQVGGGQRFVLVTSATHMWRAVRTMEAHGLKPIPAVAASQSERATAPRSWLPNGAAMRLSGAAAHEYVGALCYWSRGWLTAH
jgi:uncharacterized SAM-binding protein YcdF (DUF218 family)